jgi:peptidoglycan hydrolase CwlO-like protein
MSKPLRRDQKLHADSTQRDVLFFRERERERVLAAEKTSRLRDLRLAKEAAEREAAAIAAANKPAAPKRKRKPTSAAVVSALAESVG